MILLDANILLYAYDDRSPHHTVIRGWLETVLSKEEMVGLPWLSAWAFVRIITNPKINAQPLTPEQAMSVVTKLRNHPHVAMVNPGRHHAQYLLEEMRSAQVQGAQTTDAALAALAREHGATLASTDAGFRRFPALSWINPITL
ncbi:MAG: PIN domain-containing protein [Acidobacteria bacterium]|nr:PIN domain-containing protein [Acidobacteriota bacterium]